MPVEYSGVSSFSPTKVLSDEQVPNISTVFSLTFLFLLISPACPLFALIGRSFALYTISLLSPLSGAAHIG